MDMDESLVKKYQRGQFSVQNMTMTWKYNHRIKGCV